MLLINYKIINHFIHYHIDFLHCYDGKILDRLHHLLGPVFVEFPNALDYFNYMSHVHHKQHCP